MSYSSADSLYQLIWSRHRWAFLKVVALNLVNALVGVGIIAYINHAFINQAAFSSVSWLSLGYFFIIVIVLLFFTFISQYALTKLGHQFVYELRTQLVKQIMDTPLTQIDQVGSSRLLASLSADIQSITVAFVRMPELVQGVILSVAVALYLGWLSLPLLLIVLVGIGLNIWISLVLVRHVYVNLTEIREINDLLYEDYQAIIEGRKELTLNRHRAEQLFSQEFIPHAEAYKGKIIKADTYHLSALSWSNIMMFALIGVIFAVAQQFNISMAVATTFSLTVLFMQSPLLKAVGAYPNLQTAQVALSKIQSLQLASYKEGFLIEATALQSNAAPWQSLRLHNVSYHYGLNQPQGQDGETALSQTNNITTAALENTPTNILKNINFELTRGEVVFLIGANGSGKSTLAKVLTGLVAPTQGSMTLDNHLIDEHNRLAFNQLFSAIYSDNHLFSQLIGAQGQTPDADLVRAWLQRLALHEKIELNEGRLSTVKLSQGQRKRVAMLLAVAEQKDILLLDEWAADQDPVFRRTFYQQLIPELKALGKTLFIISHDDAYFEHADRLLMMKDGELIELKDEARRRATDDAVEFTF